MAHSINHTGNEIRFPDVGCFALFSFVLPIYPFVPNRSVVHLFFAVFKLPSICISNQAIYHAVLAASAEHLTHIPKPEERFQPAHNPIHCLSLYIRIYFKNVLPKTTRFIARLPQTRH